MDREDVKTCKKIMMKKVFQKSDLTGINRLMENHSQTLVNKDFFFIFFLHFIAKKWLKLLKNEGNYDLWKTFKWIAQLTYLI